MPPRSPNVQPSPRVYSAHTPRARRHAAFLQSQPFWLGLYFVFNLSLTLYNKARARRHAGVLVRFPFPWTLTALHAFCGSVGGYMLLEQGYYVPARTTRRDNWTLLCFSVLYTVNIAISNVSLQLVTVPFHQVVRASTPLFTIVISIALTGTRLNGQKLLTLLPVIAGVGFATYGDYYFTSWGLFLTLLGTFLASLKTVVTSMLQTPGAGSKGLKLHPLDLLLRMSPLAFIQCVLFGWYTGELERVRRFGALEMTPGKALALLVNGIIAFGLNVVSFTANKKSGPLTMTVAANVKQVLTILLAVMIFNLHISPINGVGILFTVAGGAWYAAIEYAEQTKRSSMATTSRRLA
ncbi:TPT-domain-containing protein [Auricularia subglabra TFB-10046 SS5]|nr:TPT-domain-containing protein [Auricularia subglabra TFB-10046 SS5]